jgi:hypothetical protein
MFLLYSYTVMHGQQNINLFVSVINMGVAGIETLPSNVCLYSVA